MAKKLKEEVSVKPKKLTYKEIAALPEAEFEKITRASWNKHNNSIYDDDDYIDYWDWYSTECSYYKRTPIEGY